MRRVEPTIQLSSRGLRNAPVKKMRSMWTTIDPTKMFAAQWCIWRMSRPPRTAKLKFSVEANASETGCPRSGRVRALVDDLLARRDEVEGQEDSRPEEHDERVEGDLAYQERPVVREDLVEHLSARARDPEPLVEPVEKGVNHCPAPSTPVQQARRTRPGHGNSPPRRCREEAGVTVAVPARRSGWRHR